VALAAVGVWSGGRAAAAPESAGRPVVIDVQAPAGAEIWFDDEPMKSTGEFRRFVTPPLAAGREFTYNVRVRWTQDGRPVDRTQRLAVRAGDRVKLSYAGSAAAEPGPVQSSVSFYPPPEESPVAPAPMEIRVLPAAPAGTEIRIVPTAPRFVVPPPPRYYDPGPPAGPPGSNNPMSLGVGNG
jgi:uncharacterized protein (TIGR03000 family)